MDRLRVGVISDVHSNLPALLAVLESSDAAAPEEIWCLGDVVGYGAQPDECAALVRERCAVSLNGNHDLAVIGTIDARIPHLIAGAEQSITAVPAPAAAAEHLACAPGEPVLRVDRLYTDPDGRPVELAVSHFNPVYYTYRVKLRRRLP